MAEHADIDVAALVEVGGFAAVPSKLLPKAGFLNLPIPPELERN